MKFDTYHPTINLIFFVSVIYCTLTFSHPVFLAIGYVSAFIYSVKLKGRKALVFNLCLLPLIAIYGGWYSYYNHFGVTIIGENFAGNDMTLESLVYGLVIGVTAATFIMWMSCLFEIFTSDKVVYLFGKISPKLSLFLSIILRSVPRIKAMTAKINTARKGLGRGAGQGGLIQGVKNSIRLLSIMITWTTENFVQSAESMKNRGYSLKGRSAFSIYRFDNRDRSLVLGMFICLTLIFMAAMLNQVDIIYDPEIVMNRVTWVSWVFYLAYGIYLLLPFGLQTVMEMRFKKGQAGA